MQTRNMKDGNLKSDCIPAIMKGTEGQK